MHFLSMSIYSFDAWSDNTVVVIEIERKNKTSYILVV